MAAGRGVRRLVVATVAGDRRRGLLRAGALVVACTLGRAGTRRRKREGDGATPTGRLRPVAVWYRADRGPRPTTLLPATPIRPNVGWSDDPCDPRYNRPVRLPHAFGHERLWRTDRLYDVVIVLDYNLAHPRRGAGSAIFLHVASPDMAPTEGCIAVGPLAMRRLLTALGPDTVIDVR